MNAAEIKEGFLKLTLEERLHLLQELWDGLAEHSAALDLSPDEQAELERRYQAHLAQPESSTTWEAFQRELRSRH